MVVQVVKKVDENEKISWGSLKYGGKIGQFEFEIKPIRSKNPYWPGISAELTVRFRDKKVTINKEWHREESDLYKFYGYDKFGHKLPPVFESTLDLLNVISKKYDLSKLSDDSLKELVKRTFEITDKIYKSKKLRLVIGSSNRFPYENSIVWNEIYTKNFVDLFIIPYVKSTFDLSEYTDGGEINKKVIKKAVSDLDDRVKNIISAFYIPFHLTSGSYLVDLTINNKETSQAVLSELINNLNDNKNRNFWNLANTIPSLKRPSDEQKDPKVAVLYSFKQIWNNFVKGSYGDPVGWKDVGNVEDIILRDVNPSGSPLLKIVTENNMVEYRYLPNEQLGEGWFSNAKKRLNEFNDLFKRELGGSSESGSDRGGTHRENVKSGSQEGEQKAETKKAKKEGRSTENKSKIQPERPKEIEKSSTLTKRIFGDVTGYDTLINLLGEEQYKEYAVIINKNRKYEGQDFILFSNPITHFSAVVYHIGMDKWGWGKYFKRIRKRLKENSYINDVVYIANIVGWSAAYYHGFVSGWKGYTSDVLSIFYKLYYGEKFEELSDPYKALLLNAGSALYKIALKRGLVPPDKKKKTKFIRMFACLIAAINDRELFNNIDDLAKFSKGELNTILSPSNFKLKENETFALISDTAWIENGNISIVNTRVYYSKDEGKYKYLIVDRDGKTLEEGYIDENGKKFYTLDGNIWTISADKDGKLHTNIFPTLRLAKVEIGVGGSLKVVGLARKVPAVNESKPFKIEGTITFQIGPFERWDIGPMQIVLKYLLEGKESVTFDEGGIIKVPQIISPEIKGPVGGIREKQTPWQWPDIKEPKVPVHGGVVETTQIPDSIQSYVSLQVDKKTKQDIKWGNVGTITGRGMLALVSTYVKYANYTTFKDNLKYDDTTLKNEIKNDASEFLENVLIKLDNKTYTLEDILSFPESVDDLTDEQLDVLARLLFQSTGVSNMREMLRQDKRYDHFISALKRLKEGDVKGYWTNMQKVGLPGSKALLAITNNVTVYMPVSQTHVSFTGKSLYGKEGMTSNGYISINLSPYLTGKIMNFKKVVVLFGTGDTFMLDLEKKGNVGVSKLTGGIEGEASLLTGVSKTWVSFRFGLGVGQIRENKGEISKLTPEGRLQVGHEYVLYSTDNWYVSARILGNIDVSSWSKLDEYTFVSKVSSWLTVGLPVSKKLKKGVVGVIPFGSTGRGAWGGQRKGLGATLFVRRNNDVFSLTPIYYTGDNITTRGGELSYSREGDIGANVGVYESSGSIMAKVGGNISLDYVKSLLSSGKR